MRFSLAGVSAPFLGLCSLFRELKCGVSFWLCSLFLLFILGLTIWGVVRHLGRLLDGHHSSLPFELVKDGDLPLRIERMLRLRGLHTVRITKVKGHADEALVLDGRVGEIDRLGNNAADEAADFGRRRVVLSLMRVVICRGLWTLVLRYSEKAQPRYLWPGRPISVSAVPFGPGTDIWRSCRFIGAMMRSLCLLPGGPGRFVFQASRECL